MTTTRATFDDFLAWLESGRRRGLVHFGEQQHCWHVLGHPEANAILSDSARFSSDLSPLPARRDDLALFRRGNFVRMDPPQHRKLRTLVSQAFTPKVIAGLEPRIAELTSRLLGQERDPDEAVLAVVLLTMREMNDYFLDYLRFRRANLGADLTSKLVAARVDGERLTDPEIVGFVVLLLLAGHKLPLAVRAA